MSQSSWIRQNMFENRNSGSSEQNVSKKKNNQRPLTEAEIKVQRSLEKLSIPEWYLNKSSIAPKILMYDTPIDARVSPWKTPGKTSNASSSPILNNKKLSGSSSSQQQPNRRRKTPQKTVGQLINRLDTWNIQSPAKPLIKYTQSFPKVSPSRKIENINIVFPPQNKIVPEIDENILNTNKNHRNDEDGHNKNNETKFGNSERNENESKSTDKHSKNVENYFSSQMNCNSSCQSIVDGCKKLSIKVTDVDKLLETSMNRSISNIQAEKSPKHCSRLDGKSKSSPTTILSIVRKNIALNQEITDAPSSGSQDFEKLHNNHSILFKQSDSSSVSRHLPYTYTGFKLRKTLMPIDENNAINANNEYSSKSSTSSDDFMNTTKKSTTMEKIVKREMVGGGGLIQEIIQEFQKKCNESANPTYTPGSKKFVKKLCKILEDSIIEDSKQEEESSESGDSQNLDKKSATFLLSTSSKRFDDESSVIEPPLSLSPSSSLSSSPDYGGGRQMHINSENLMKKSSPPKTNEISWISLPPSTKLSRTSSALSMKSRSSTSSSRNKSPCVSPIRENRNTQHINTNTEMYWSSSSNKNNLKTCKGLGVRKPYIVCDSGYADNTDHSLLLESFLSEYDASQSTSEFEISRTRQLFQKTPLIFSRSIKI